MPEKDQCDSNYRVRARREPRYADCEWIAIADSKTGSCNAGPVYMTILSVRSIPYPERLLKARAKILFGLRSPVERSPAFWLIKRNVVPTSSATDALSFNTALGGRLRPEALASTLVP